MTRTAHQVVPSSSGLSSPVANGDFALMRSGIGHAHSRARTCAAFASGEPRLAAVRQREREYNRPNQRKEIDPFPTQFESAEGTLVHARASCTASTPRPRTPRTWREGEVSSRSPVYQSTLRGRPYRGFLGIPTLRSAAYGFGAGLADMPHQGQVLNAAIHLRGVCRIADCRPALDRPLLKHHSSYSSTTFTVQRSDTDR